MIESVERLKKFVAASEKRNHQNIGYILDDVGLDISDLKEALSLIPPYAPYQEINVRDWENNEWKRRPFLFMEPGGTGVFCKNLSDAAVHTYWKYHRTIPETVDLKGFPVDKVELAESMLEENAKSPLGYAKQIVSLCQAIVTSARKE